MVVEISEMAANLRSISIFMLKKSYTWVCNHPFLLCLLLFLLFLYRSFPLLFSLLVSSSPVFVCTAVLLGTLLSFGQPATLPEIKKDEKFMNRIESLRTDSVIVDKTEGFCVEQLNLVVNTSRELARDNSLDSSSPLIGEGFREIKSNKIDNNAKHVDDEMDMSPSESFDSRRVNVDSLDFPPCSSPWKNMEERDEVDEGEEEDDDESDQAESSSPDASMADIIPLLDELHPLLDENAPHPVPLSHDGSDAASESSDESSESESVLSEDTNNDENHEDLDGADEVEEQYNKESLTWTEEDQKNLMDLGSSELERNQRLESLIARRRARKTISMMPVRNLIDLESNDLSFNIAPISTSRNNPFDIDHDSYYSNIPGSAPSILLPRRNPFDIPYDSSEEKPNLLGDSFQQEFSSSQSKEQIFRRRESFNVGPSVFGPNRFKPFFVPERSYFEESSYSPFQRQSSGLSDSKASSIPETESVISTRDIEEENNLVLQDNINQNAGPVNFVPEIDVTIQSRDLETKNSSNDKEFSQEKDVNVKMEDVSDHVGHGSQSSEEERLTGDDIHRVEQLSVSNNVEVHDISGSRLSLLSENSEKIFPHRDADGRAMSVQEHERNKETESVGDTHHKEPIFDCSPTSISKNASLSSLLSELDAAESDMIKGPVESESGGQKLDDTADTKDKKTEIDTSKIDLPLNHQGYNSTIIKPDVTEFVGSQSVNGVESLGTSSKNTDALTFHEPEIYSNGQHCKEENYFPDFCEELIFLDRRSMDVETPSGDQHREEEPPVTEEEISEESSPRESLNVSDFQEFENVPANNNLPTSPESINISSEAYESQAVECYSDDEFENDSQFQATELQNMDYVEEELLSELDTVGDFSAGNVESGLHVFETDVASHEEADLSGTSIINHENETNFVVNSNLEMPVNDSSEGLHKSQYSRKIAISEENPMIEEAQFSEYVLDDDDDSFQKSNMEVSSETPLINSSDMSHEGQSQTVETTNSKTHVDSEVLTQNTMHLPILVEEKAAKDNEAGGVNDEQSNEKEFVPKVVTVPETSVLTSNETGISDDQQLSMNQSLLLETTNRVDTNSDTKFAVPESSVVVSHHVLQENTNSADCRKFSCDNGKTSEKSNSSSSDSDNESK